LVRPGDRVNVMAYFTKSDLIPETGVRTVLTGVKVFAVDGRTSRGDEVDASQAANTVSLLIDKEDEEAWTLASELGRIRLSLGRPAETGSLEANESGGQAFLKWMSDYQLQLASAAKSGDDGGQGSVTTKSAKRSEGFKMLKLHGGEWTEYEFIDGKRTPIIKSSSEKADDNLEPIQTTATDEQSGYSYLNGSQSPFFEPGNATSGEPTSRGSKSTAPLSTGVRSAP
jgi:pilus assembly protein CpaB